MRTWDYWLDEVATVVAGAEIPFMLHHIKEAAIEFCEQSHVHQLELSPIDTHAGQMMYLIDSGIDEFDVVQVIAASLSGKDLTITGWGELSQSVISQGTPRFLIQETENKVSLQPTPDGDVADALVLKVSLKPSRTHGTGLPNDIAGRYFQGIAHLAKSKLYAVPKRAWTDNALSVYHSSMARTAIAKAKRDAFASLGRRIIRTKIWI